MASRPDPMDAPLPGAEKAEARHDPRAYLDEAEASLKIVSESYWDDQGHLVERHLARASAYAGMATAAAMFMPTPDEVLATYEETRGEVLGEVEADLIARVEKAKRIIGDAIRDGSRRHPALHAALEALDVLLREVVDTSTSGGC